MLDNNGIQDFFRAKLLKYLLSIMRPSTHTRDTATKNAQLKERNREGIQCKIRNETINFLYRKF